jgi:alkylation response protein AidB-like acyl-CoA dehydrogenase
VTASLQDRSRAESADHALMIDAVETFLRRHLPPEEIRRRDENHIPPYDLVPQIRDLGLLRAAFPVEAGGLALPWSTLCRLQERIGARAFFVASIINRFVSFGGLPVWHFGSERQRAELLPRILDGAALVALALTEPDAGSDARAVRTRARREGETWRIAGRKTWISDADHASYLLTLCRSDEDAGQTRGYTAFLVPRRATGVHMTPLPKVGNNCMPSYDIAFDDVVVSDADRLGAVGAGFPTITGTLKYSRASMAAAAVGTAQAALDLAKSHALAREQFGRSLAAFQVIKHRLVDMHLEIRKARLLVRELAAAIDAGEDTEEIGAATKIVATETLQMVTHHGMQILASAGYAAESPMQRYWRDARLYSFGEGTNEIQREIIASRIGLGRKEARKEDPA